MTALADTATANTKVGKQRGTVVLLIVGVPSFVTGVLLVLYYWAPWFGAAYKPDAFPLQDIFVGGYLPFSFLFAGFFGIKSYFNPWRPH